MLTNRNDHPTATIDDIRTAMQFAAKSEAFTDIVRDLTRRLARHGRALMCNPHELYDCAVDQCKCPLALAYDPCVYVDHRGREHPYSQRITYGDGWRAISYRYAAQDAPRIRAELVPDGPSYCQHEFDCCGRWYVSDVRVGVRPNGDEEATVSWIQNI